MLDARTFSRFLRPAAALLLAASAAACFDSGAANDDEAETETDTHEFETTGGSPGACDPERFDPICSEGAVLACSEDGEITRTSCGDGSCVFGSEGVGCVWPLGENCEGSYAACDEVGGVHACIDGVWTFDPCPVGGSCVGGTCYGPGAAPCDPAQTEPWCDGEQRLQCNADGFQVPSDCPNGEICRDGDTGATCVSSDAAPCDPDAFVWHCGSENEVRGCLDVGWTITATCEPGQRCFDSAFGATCADADAEPCDPTTATPSCQDGVATSCSPQGVLNVTACADDEQCRVDQWCLTDCLPAAACIPSDAAPCDEPSDALCDGDDLVFCFDGATVPVVSDCDCVEEDGTATCTG